mgnify:CR=1 FL=1
MSVFDYVTVRQLATGLKFPEGPVAWDDGSITVVEIEGGSVAQIRPSGEIRRFDCGGGPNGSAVGPDGLLYVCNDGGLVFRTIEDGAREPYGAVEGYTGGALQRVDPESGEVETLFTQSGGEPLGVLNDIVFDTGGGAYVVDTTGNRLHYMHPGMGEIAIVATDVTHPNGGALSADGKTLYISETYNARLVAFEVLSSGELGAPQEIFRSTGGYRFDGLAVDGAGHLCVANMERSEICVFDPSGEQVAAFQTPRHDPYVTNICFGGPEGSTAFITSAGHGILYSVEWPWPGLRLNFAA